MGHRILITIAFLALLCAHRSSSAQTRIELIKAESLEYNETSGSKTKKLKGNVVFKHENTLMYCDSANLYENNALDAFSNVKIIRGDSMTAYGDLLKYNGNTGIAELHNNVTLNDKLMSLTTAHLNYNMKNNTGQYFSGGKIIDKNTVLTSKTGYYFSASKELFFKDSVRLKNPQYTIESDTLKYNTLTKTTYYKGPSVITTSESKIYCSDGWSNSDTEVSVFKKNARIVSKGQVVKADSIAFDGKNDDGIAYGHVSITDSAQSTTVTGDLSRFNEKTNTQFVTGHALFIQYETKDTLFLHADTLKTISDSVKGRVFFAYHGVRFFKEDLQGQCDSLKYNFKDSTINMYKQPVIWSGDNQLTARNMIITTTKGGLKDLDMLEEAFIISREDTNYYNQVKGDNMKGYFKGDKLSHVNVYNNSQTIYFAREDSGKYIGINRASSKDMRIEIADEKIQRIKFYKDPKAVLHPFSDYNEKDFRLEGFLWKEEERPESKDDLIRSRNL